MITELPVAETPSDALPVSDLGFGRYFTDRMFSQHYTRGRGWHDAVIGPYAPITLDPAAQVLHNGQMIFDGTKAYRRPDGRVNLFRPERNAERFNRSAARMGMPEVPVAEHVAAGVPSVAVAVDQDGVDPAFIAREREIFVAQAVESGKPQAIAEKMVGGRIAKLLGEITLLGQPWVRDDKQTIKDLVAATSKAAGAPLAVKRFVRFKMGES